MVANIVAFFSTQLVHWPIRCYKQILQKNPPFTHSSNVLQTDRRTDRWNSDLNSGEFAVQRSLQTKSGVMKILISVLLVEAKIKQMKQKKIKILTLC